MRPSVWLGVLALAVVAGCSNRFDSKLLGVVYDPPKGTSLLDERPGAPPTARFTSGIEMRSVNRALPAFDDGQDLETVLKDAVAAANMQLPGSVMSASTVALHGQSVARYELKDGAYRSIVYLVPAGQRFLLLKMRSDNTRYPHQQMVFERSLKSLHVKEAPTAQAALGE